MPGRLQTLSMKQLGSYSLLVLADLRSRGPAACTLSNLLRKSSDENVTRVQNAKPQPAIVYASSSSVYGTNDKVIVSPTWPSLYASYIKTATCWGSSFASMTSFPEDLSLPFRPDTFTFSVMHSIPDCLFILCGKEPILTWLEEVYCSICEYGSCRFPYKLGGCSFLALSCAGAFLRRRPDRPTCKLVCSY